MMTPEKLIGRTFDIAYVSEHSQDTYQIQIKDDKKLTWKRIKGTDGVGKGDEEDYIMTQITNDKLLITWVEADGLGLSNILDFQQGTCLTHGNNGRNVWKHTGVLTLHDAE